MESTVRRKSKKLENFKIINRGAGGELKEGEDKRPRIDQKYKV
jgi:hypothetical protein